MNHNLIPTNFILNLKGQFINDLHINDSLCNEHIINLININNKSVFTNLNFLKKCKDSILIYIAEVDKVEQVKLLNSICTALETVKNTHHYKTTYKNYCKIYEDKSGITNNKNKKKDTITWSEIYDKWSQMKVKFDDIRLSEKISSRKDIDMIQDFVILSLFVLHNPKSNHHYNNMWIQCEEPTDTLSKLKNYYNPITKNFTFIFSQKMGIPLEEHISDDLSEILDYWIKIHPGLSRPDYIKGKDVKLFVNYIGIPQKTNNFITLRLNGIFKDYNNVGVNVIKKAFTLTKLGDDYESFVHLENENPDDNE